MKHYRLFVVAVIIAWLLLCLTACAQAQPITFSIPFHEVNTRILIDADVYGHPFTLLFDTGARASVIRDMKYFGKTFDCQLAMHRGQFSCAGEVSVAFVQPEIRIDGILGADVTCKFASVTVDYVHHVIIFVEK